MKSSEFLELAPRVLPVRLAQWAAIVAPAAESFDVCPWLVLSIMERESRGGEILIPPGPAGSGDWRMGPDPKDPTKKVRLGRFGRGRGLMQIDEKSHRLFVERVLPDGTYAWQSPAENIVAGVEELAAAWRHWRQPALRLDPLVAEHAAVASYNAGVEHVARALPRGVRPELAISAIDAVTAHGDYARTVVTRWKRWLVLAEGMHVRVA